MFKQTMRFYIDDTSYSQDVGKMYEEKALRDLGYEYAKSFVTKQEEYQYQDKHMLTVFTYDRKLDLTDPAHKHLTYVGAVVSYKLES